jgi:hypothetical protein
LPPQQRWRPQRELKLRNGVARRRNPQQSARRPSGRLYGGTTLNRTDARPVDHSVDRKDVDLEARLAEARALVERLKRERAAEGQGGKVVRLAARRRAR